MLQCNGPGAPETPAFVKSVQGVQSTGDITLARSPSPDLREISKALASSEKKLPMDGDLRGQALTELARLCFILGEFGEERESESYFDRGRHYAELLSREQPDRVEGHYWLGLNIAGLAKVGGAGRGLRLVPTIIEKLEVALVIDETYDQAGPHRTLGRIYCKAPCWPLSEGDINKSLEHLRAAVEIAPENSTNHLYLAETLIQLGKSGEAYRELERVFTSTRHAIWQHGLEQDRQEVLGLMRHCERPEADTHQTERTGTILLPGEVSTANNTAGRK